MKTYSTTIRAALAALAFTACSSDRAVTSPEALELEPSLSRGSEKNTLPGAVYSMSNDAAGNDVVVYNRAKDGTLSFAGSYSTGGNGSGGFEDSANGLVLGSDDGESAPNNLQGDSKFLFATNAGSNTISVFRVNKNDTHDKKDKRDAITLVEVQNSGGEKPVSLTVNNGILYVLNSGEFIDGEIAIPNCTTGNLPSITGFSVSDKGELTPIPNSTRQLSGDPPSGCAQVSFNPSGTVLVVTERLAQDEDPTSAAGDEGVINTFVLNADGTPGTHQIFDATGEGPFGFTFNKSGALLTTEQFDGPMGVGRGAAAGYMLNASGTLTATSPSVQNGGTDTCWFVVTDDGVYGYTTSFFGTGQISLYRVSTNGALALIDATADDGAAGTGASDLSLSKNSEYLYQLNSLRGTISEYRVASNGGLALVQVVQAHPASATAAPMGIAAR
ncbi:MAG: beta-propeller fold lactonase family protein [Gemmatimonadaceae bacterium]